MDSFTVQNKTYWCFDCKTDLANITSQFACSKCDSLAIEEITLLNDPRKYQIPVIQSTELENEQDPETNIDLHVLTIQGENISITIIGGIQRFDGNTGQQAISILRMLRTMMSRGEQETPATEAQIQSLQNVSHVQCSVCQEDGGLGLKLDCGHSFHKDCILPWFQRKNTCPCCRKQLSSQ